jgi:hypothetical protein
MLFSLSPRILLHIRSSDHSTSFISPGLTPTPTIQVLTRSCSRPLTYTVSPRPPSSMLDRARMTPFSMGSAQRPFSLFSMGCTSPAAPAVFHPTCYPPLAGHLRVTMEPYSKITCYGDTSPCYTFPLSLRHSTIR